MNNKNIIWKIDSSFWGGPHSANTQGPANI